jgi:myo-inositol 2-dehydrogenase/D-chiro-inositol 1-dehydrogenase
MGAEHASIMAREIGGCSLEAIADADRGRAAAIAGKLGISKVEADGLALIDDPQIDAVLIASSDETHFDLSMTCVRLGKPVFCEKPLAMTSTDCLRLVEAEMGVGRRLLQVGFMRRFDQGYLDMKAAVDGKRFGSPLFLHCIHRIATAPHYFKTELIHPRVCPSRPTIGESARTFPAPIHFSECIGRPDGRRDFDRRTVRI